MQTDMLYDNMSKFQIIFLQAHTRILRESPAYFLIQILQLPVPIFFIHETAADNFFETKSPWSIQRFMICSTVIYM